MLRSIALPLIATVALLAGCNLESLDTAEGMQPITHAMETPPLGQELHRMFADEKRNALAAELPAQF